MTVVIRKVLPEEAEELKVISEDTFRETFAHDNTESQLQAYFDTALSEEVLLDEITHEESRYFFILVDGEKAGFLKTNVGSAQTIQRRTGADARHQCGKCVQNPIPHPCEAWSARRFGH
jgi:hypothetical protein